MNTEDDSSPDSVLSAEYVLRLMDSTEQLAFEERMNNESHLRELVYEWEQRFAGLYEDIGSVEPPSSIRQNLNQKLFQDKKKTSQGLTRFFSGRFAAVAVLVCAVVLTPYFYNRVSDQPTFVAEVAAQDGSLLVIANYYDADKRLEIYRKSGTALPGRSLELWLIADGAENPKSLGLLSTDSATTLELAGVAFDFSAGSVLAISDEPIGGSPTGLPTGAVLATGTVSGA